MKIALSLQYNDDFREIAAITVPVIQAYALRHGYSFFAHKSERSSPDIVWERAEDALMLLPRFSAVVHMDADCLITNSAISIESIMEERNDDYFTSTDVNGDNDGFSIWRNKLGVIEVLRALRAHSSYVPRLRDYSSPQAALVHPSFPGTLYRHRFPQRQTNSYLMAEYPSLPADPNAEWQPGDFILHLPGIGNARRLQILQQYAK